MVKFWESLAKSIRPQSKSYATVLDATKDELTKAKLQFFSYVASLLQPMLVKYQTNWPMVPYYFQDFFSLSKCLMRLIVKPDVLVTITTGRQLQNFDFSKRENLINIASITIGFAAESSLKELKKQDMIPVGDLKNFMKECRLLVITLLEKLFQRGLINWIIFS